VSLSLEGVGELATVIGFVAGLGFGFLVVRLTQQYWVSRRVLEPSLAARRTPEALIIQS
jgi:uncharacterized membrane-anchored protein YhcB (DUF1043 family)